MSDDIDNCIIWYDDSATKHYPNYIEVTRYDPDGTPNGGCFSFVGHTTGFVSLTDTGPKKSSTQDCVSFSWTFGSAPLSTPLLIFRQKFERENSHGP